MNKVEIRGIPKTMELNPPDGWFVFGTHIAEENRPNGLEFYGSEYSDDGLPIWERPL